MPIALLLAVTAWIRSVLQTGGYAALAGLTLLENLFPPIPSEVVLPLAGFYVGRGELVFVLALLAATAGSLAGALILYGAGRFGGRFAERSRGGEQLAKAQEWFDRHGPKVVFLGRLVPVCAASSPSRRARRRCRCRCSCCSPPPGRCCGTRR